MLLGPLPAGEAALYLREHAGLSQMVFSGDAAEKALALRLLNASRFHPLLDGPPGPAGHGRPVAAAAN